MIKLFDWEGSSPLARGLRRARQAKPILRRIIPARAGFTAMRRTLSRRVQDHPRSRGVYRPVLFNIDTPTLDHPRSRGVYQTVDSKPTPSAGSSPLARGLRSWRVSSRWRMRIIPARAGFTSLTPMRVCLSRDHPRSRGVYGDVVDNMSQSLGSSPLARGLLWSVMDVSPRWGIIPARAGFTTDRDDILTSMPDHPRSRGVYNRPRSRSRRCAGSSPLARGLLPGTMGLPGDDRIIPARAGFTAVWATTGGRLADHPRSRGVYRDVAVLVRLQEDHPRSRGVYHGGKYEIPFGRGSSPLARGLLL